MRLRFATLTIFVMLFSAQFLFCEVPTQLTMSMRIKQYGQLFSATKPMRFTIYNALTAGQSVWSSGDVTVNVTSGVVSYVFAPAIDWRGKDYWLETMIDNKVMKPRQRLTSQPYAMHSATAEDVIKSAGQDIHFWIGSSTPVYITSAGKVGIGTTAPAEMLEVTGRLLLGANSTPTATAGTIRWSGTNFEGYNGSTWKTLDVQSTSGGGFTESGSVIHTTNADRNVGIGTTNPAVQLNIVKSNADAGFNIDTWDDGSSASKILLRKSDDDTISSTIAQTDNGDVLGQIVFQGGDNANNFANGGLITVTQQGVAGACVPTRMQLQTYSDSAANAGITIDSSGNVGIGLTNPTSIGTAVTTLEMNGGNGSGFKMGTSGGVVSQVYTGGDGLILDAQANKAVILITNSNERMRINGAGNVGIGTTNPGYKLEVNGTGKLNDTAWTYSSDRRLKENISPLLSGFDIIGRLNPVRFDYIKGSKKQVGFIAQEVQQVIPGIVSQGSDGMLGMKTDSIIPYLVNAIKEQQKRIEELERKVK